MEDRKGNLSQFILTELFFDDVVDPVWRDEITVTLVFGFGAESFTRQNTS